MAMPSSSLRRCAAWAVLAPLLDEETVIAALWLQHEQMRGDAVSDIIRFIDQVADRHLFDAPTRRKLYEAYHHAMRRPVSELPMDPWPLMQSLAPAPQRPEKPAPARPQARTTTPESRPATTTEPVAAAPAAPEKEAPAAAVVFAGLCTGILHEVEARFRDQLADLKSSFTEQLERSRIAKPLRTRLDSAWVAGTPAAWQVDADEKSLATVVSQLYVALCECLGPVQADLILTAAVKRASRLPQAGAFSPHRLI